MEDDGDCIFDMWKQLHAKKIQDGLATTSRRERSDPVTVEWDPFGESVGSADDPKSNQPFVEYERNVEVRPTSSALDSSGEHSEDFCCASELMLCEAAYKSERDYIDRRKATVTDANGSQVFQPFTYAWKQKCSSHVGEGNETVDKSNEKSHKRGDAVENKKLVYRNACRPIPSLSMYSGSRSRPLGLVSREFKPPIRSLDEQQGIGNSKRNDCKKAALADFGSGTGDEHAMTKLATPESSSDSVVRSVDEELLGVIESEIVQPASCSWDDVAGLAEVKSTVKEIVIWPMLRPDIFKGLRAPSKGILFFGPPGTGKTLIGGCIASQCKATFFSISASSLTSKWVGEGEKLVRALFTVARLRLPSVIFIDEVDSLLTKRSESDHESTRRMKNEFFSQMEGVGVSKEERLLVVGATNRPWELDEAALRRFTRRLYVPLPNAEARADIIKRLLSAHKHSVSDTAVNSIAQQCEGYSGADMEELCREAALFPVRRIPEVESIDLEQVPPITEDDFENARCRIKSTVCLSSIAEYERWNLQYGFIRSVQP
uniref:AAA+ ATPase domain-containing protein n=1 Tax=Trichuris muris TaxID=70415 RepID=A0A5S6QSF0_TRIMR